MTRRTHAAALVGVVLLISSCGDDANDAALRARREAERIDAIRSADASPAAVEPSVTAADDDPPDIDPTGVVVPVIAIDNIFRPESIVVSVGDEVVWENRGQNDHDVLYVDGDDWGVEIEDFGPGAVYSHVFAAPGEYDYYCSIHGTTTFGMIGTVVVES